MDNANQTSWLLVDEERFSRGYLRSVLTRQPGIQLLDAESGLRAMEILSTTPVDGIILDLSLSDFDGYALLDLIRTHPLASKAFVAVASKHPTESSVKRAKSRGADDYLIKPFQSAETDLKLRKMVEFVESRQHIAPATTTAQKKRVLIADDANFCSFAKTALSGRYDVMEAASPLDILVKVNSWTPDLLLLNGRQRGLNWAFLYAQLQRLSPSRGLQVHLLGDEKDLLGPVESGCSGWLARGFIPEVFCSGVASILEPGLLNARTALAWLRNFAPEINSSVRQVLGMMTLVEPVPVENPEPVQLDLVGSLRLQSKTDAVGMLLEMQCNKGLATNLAARLTGLEEADIDEELQGSGVTELLNVVGGRLVECCRGRDLHLKTGLPILGLEPTPAVAPIFRWEKVFRWGDAELFRMALRCFENWGTKQP